jgi:enoyl-CoA hydratase/carnithine racemase
MTDLPLLSRCADGVMVLTLNRPERRNALSPELYELLQALEEGLDGEAWRHARCVETADHKEATLAYMEKRAPQYSRGK